MQIATEVILFLSLGPFGNNFIIATLHFLSACCNLHYTVHAIVGNDSAADIAVAGERGETGAATAQMCQGIRCGVLRARDNQEFCVCYVNVIRWCFRCRVVAVADSGCARSTCVRLAAERPSCVVVSSRDGSN